LRIAAGHSTFSYFLDLRPVHNPISHCKPLRCACALQLLLVNCDIGTTKLLKCHTLRYVVHWICCKLLLFD